MSPFKASDAIERLKKVLNVSSDRALAEYLGVNNGTLVNWKKKDTIDVSVIAKVLTPEQFNFVMTGDLESAKENLVVNEQEMTMLKGTIKHLLEKIDNLEDDLKKNEDQIRAMQDDIKIYMGKIEYLKKEEARLKGLVSLANN